MFCVIYEQYFLVHTKLKNYYNGVLNSENTDAMCLGYNYLDTLVSAFHSDNKVVFIKDILGIRLADNFRSFTAKQISSLKLRRLL